jgi:cysteinyl-tRNA synthetase
MPDLRLYNTLGRSLQPFIPLKPDSVGFYGCGPTVYNFAHIGNLRAYVFHDCLVRSLRWLGYTVTHVMNLTDVGHLTGDDDSGEDKMLKSATERNQTVLDIARFYTEAFFRDTDLLGIVRPTIVCKATEHIDEMIALIQRIESRGYTYQAGGNLYFDISRMPGYGELAMLKTEDLKAGARIDVDDNKRNPHDFVLWFTKSKFENQALIWDSPWGRGYPGWHIECSAMSMKYLGEQFDIHAGGIDHIPVHHSNEIAQSEAATGKKWVNYWLHNEFLVLDKGKMSKSKGGFLTLSALLERGFEALDYRYFLLGGHYRSQIQFSWEALESARSSRASLKDRILALRNKAGLRADDPVPAGDRVRLQSSAPTMQYLGAFTQALCDDIAMPRTLAALWGLLRDGSVPPLDALAGAVLMDEVLGLGIAQIRPSVTATSQADDGDPGAEVDALVAERSAAKRARDFARADAIRVSLKERGILLEDGPAGTVWRRL